MKTRHSSICDRSAAYRALAVPYKFLDLALKSSSDNNSYLGSMDSNPSLSLRFSIYQVSQALDLGEVKSTALKGTSRKLAWGGRPTIWEFCKRT